MSAIQIQAQVSPNELLRGVEQLNLPELEDFVQQVVALYAQRKAPSLSKSEAELLLKINQRLPSDMQLRYDTLVSKRKAETLTPDEHQELLDLIDQIEKADVERVQYMVDLAQLRGISLTALMQDLGIGPTYA